MKVVGIVLLILGFLALAGGLIGVVCLRLMTNHVCEAAARDAAEAERLTRDANAARGSPDSDMLRERAFEKGNDAEVSASICSDHKDIATIATVAGFVISAVGFVTTVAGFFVFRRGRRAGAQ